MTRTGRVRARPPLPANGGPTEVCARESTEAVIHKKTFVRAHRGLICMHSAPQFLFLVGGPLRYELGCRRLDRKQADCAAVPRRQQQQHGAQAIRRPSTDSSCPRERVTLADRSRSSVDSCTAPELHPPWPVSILG